MYYRFTCKGLGIYEVVGQCCPSKDVRRLLKPDGGWLPKVGERYPGAKSYWTDLGLRKYIHSGLQDWHRSVVDAEVMVEVHQDLDEIVYQDEWQVISQAGSSVTPISWEDFSQEYSEFELIEKVTIYVVRHQKTRGPELLVFDHDPQYTDAGTQVPGGGIDPGETPLQAAFRETFEESGLRLTEAPQKIDEYVTYKPDVGALNRRHVFQFSGDHITEDRWTHQVTGSGEDKSLQFHYYWIPVEQAKGQLACSLGSSLTKLQSSSALRGKMMEIQKSNDRTRVFTNAPWEKKVGYCRAIQTGPIITITGTAPIDENGATYCPGDAYQQTRKCLDIIQSTLRELGADVSHVTRTRIFVTDISRWEEYGRAHHEVFKDHPPATTMVEVQSLIDPEMLVEIEVDAYFSI